MSDNFLIVPPSRIGGGDFTDFQSPAAGATDLGKAWAWNNATAKFEPASFEIAGVAASALADHVAAADPHTGYVLADGTRAMTGALTVPAIKNAILSQPSVSALDFSMVGYFDRNELVIADKTGSITVSVTGAYTSITDPGAMVDGTGLYAVISGTDLTTTQIKIVVDMGANGSNFGRARWQPFLAYRFIAGGQPTYYNNVAVHVSSDNVNWYAPASGWNTTDFLNNQVTPGLWMGTEQTPSIPGNLWRYARFTLTSRVEDAGYASKALVWIAHLGVRHVSAAFNKKYMSRSGSTVYGKIDMVPGLIDAPARFRPGATASSLTDGDVWYLTADRLKFRRSTTTETIPSGVPGAAFTQTYATADRTIAAYTADNESSAYTGIDNAQAGTVYARLTDINELRTAVENQRLFTEDIAQALNAAIDDLQSFGISQ